MEKFDIYHDIAERTNGSVYVGVVGPVRTGKSTFIKKFMENLVLPNIEDKYKLARAVDELPQSGDGKTIMTTEPKFVPADAVQMSIAEGVEVKVRLVDCVGFPIDGAIGGEEDGKPRMVHSPWSEEEIPFLEAAEIGTEKVINEHASVAFLITTDGTPTGIDRSKYLEAEEKVVERLKLSGKPFAILVNSTNPDGEVTTKIAKSLSERYGVGAYPVNVAEMTAEISSELLSKILLEFPLEYVTCSMPKWMQVLPQENALINEVITALKEKCEKAEKMRDFIEFNDLFENTEKFVSTTVFADLGKGVINVEITPSQEEFYKTLSGECGVSLEDDYKLLSYVRKMKVAGEEYEKVKDALLSVQEYGYGIVSPTLSEMTLEEPKIIKQGNRFGVKLKATAPSLHVMRVDVETEVSPILGTDREGEEMANYLLSEFEQNPANIWNTNMFGKPLSDLVRENLGKKLQAVPEEARNKMRKTLSRIVNEGRGGVICILL